MSIKPIYSQAILAGEKTVEFRRVFGANAAEAERVIMYESAPTMKIVGSFEIERVHSGLPSHYVWNVAVASGRITGIKFGPYLAYMDGAKSPSAIYVRDVVRLEKPFNPRDISPKWRPPQSYMWCPDWIEAIFDNDDWGASALNQ